MKRKQSDKQIKAKVFNALTKEIETPEEGRERKAQAYIDSAKETLKTKGKATDVLTTVSHKLEIESQAIKELQSVLKEVAKDLN